MPKKQNLTEIKIQLLVRNFILQVNFTTDYHIYNLFHYLIAQLFSNKKRILPLQNLSHQTSPESGRDHCLSIQIVIDKCPKTLLYFSLINTVQNQQKRHNAQNSHF